MTILYIAPDHYGFYKVILRGLNKNNTVNFVYSNTTTVKYKNIFEKIYNFFSKNILGVNIKTEKKKLYFKNEVDKFDHYDILFINRPDILNSQQLEYVSSKCDKKIVYYWDSFDKIKGQKETMKYFNKKYSFDKNDCTKYNLRLAHNFYFETKAFNKPEYDAFFLGTLDNRYNKLLDILKKLNNNELNAKAILYSYEKKTDKLKNKHISFINKIVPFDEASVYNKNTKIILDLKHDNQTGLSFRPFEAMGLQKKLITDNEHIKDYDFYNPNNIFIWNNNNQNLLSDFLIAPYEEVPKNIKNKYDINQWITNLIKS